MVQKSKHTLYDGISSHKRFYNRDPGYHAPASCVIYHTACTVCRHSLLAVRDNKMLCLHYSLQSKSQRIASGYIYVCIKVGQCLTHTLCIATKEGLQGRHILYSLREHNCALMLNNPYIIFKIIRERSKNEFDNLYTKVYTLRQLYST